MTMEYSEIDSVDIIDCMDIFHAIKNSQWLLMSMEDAIENHYRDEMLKDHLIYLISEYHEKMENLIPLLENALEKVMINGTLGNQVQN
jgi:hypothetical protein